MHQNRDNFDEFLKRFNLFENSPKLQRFLSSIMTIVNDLGEAIERDMELHRESVDTIRIYHLTHPKLLAIVLVELRSSRSR